MRLWVIVSLLALKAAAQEKTSAPAFRAGTELVQVNVIAQDQSGRPAANLRREDFQIYDDGEPRNAAVFLAERPAREPATIRTEGTFTNRIAPDPGSGYSVLLFDNLNTGFEHTARARLKALEAFHAIPAGDKIAMYSLWCQFQVIREFAADRDSLLRQLKAFSPAAGAVCAGSVPEPDPLPSHGRPSMADLINPQAAASRTRAAEDAARIAALQAGTIGDQEMIAIADHLSGIPGRKNLIWIAQKFPLSPVALQRLLNAGVAIYPVDAIGSTIALASEKEAHAAPILALAAITGGKAYVDRDDLDTAITEALDDGSISYTLGFYRPEGAGWGALLGGPEPSSPGMDHFKYIVSQDAKWDWRTFDFDKHIDGTINADDGRTDARNPDIKPFLAHKGKLLMYHGWSDQLVPTETTIAYYEDVAKKMGGVSKIDQQVRMFLAPGMGHCGGGDGPNTFDTLTALDQWVGSVKAPDQMIASHLTAGKVDRTRPLCAYPKVATWTGTGSIDDASNFACK